ncbi:MAG: hypothetical protein LUH47_07780 [Clostridiales bacterium]|nr:hypothetical protein [Clostridiales bacterium]
MKKNSRKFSGFTKRVIALAVCFTALAQGTVFAASSSHRVSGSGKKIIEEEAAIDYVCKDLGIDEEDAEIESSGVVFENGQYVYKIHIVYGETEYVYDVRAIDGVVAKVTSPAPAEKVQTETEAVTEESTESSIDLDALESEDDNSSKKPAGRTAGFRNIISKREAIDYACGDIGIDAEETDIKSAEIVLDGGQYVYQICYIHDGIEYTYNIRVYNGAVVKRTLTPVK